MKFLQFKKKSVWKVAAVTDAGNVRAVNQDNFYIMETVLPHTSLVHYENIRECRGAVLAAVCDGMGGESRGEDASYLASHVLETAELKSLTELPTVELEQEIGRLIQKMSDVVYQNLGSSGVFAGSTVVLFYCDHLRTVVANVGDSICIRFHPNGTQLVTVSDNYANRLYEKGEITEEERWVHEAKRQLTQCLGEDPQDFMLQPHIYVADSMEAGEIYLLSSDGLTDGVKIPQIIEMVRQNPVPSVIRDLVDTAKSGGSRDNVTAVFVQRKTD